jgi:hypothetical protein
MDERKTNWHSQADARGGGDEWPAAAWTIAARSVTDSPSTANS